MKLVRFLVYYHLFAFLIAVVSLALDYLFPDQNLLSPYYWALFLSLFGITLIAYMLSDAGIRQGGELSVYSLLGGIFIKMLLSLGIVVFLIIKFPDYKMVTALNFFSLYLLFTAFEVICLLRNLRHQKKS